MLCFFFNDTATTEIYTLPLHDALPIYLQGQVRRPALAHPPPDLPLGVGDRHPPLALVHEDEDRKSTRLNSSHANISYAVFCLKKKHHYQPDLTPVLPHRPVALRVLVST